LYIIADAMILKIQKFCVQIFLSLSMIRKNDYDDDCETPPELLRLMEQGMEEIKPHQEEIKIINLGEEGEEKQVKIDTTMTEEM